jgi:hypothetical protein
VSETRNAVDPTGDSKVCTPWAGSIPRKRLTAHIPAWPVARRLIPILDQYT